jgi:glycosyltransferase involved in cell wall biosynthesis
MKTTKFDVLIQDTTTPLPYDSNTLATRALGGTEASVIRVAEAMGSLGLKVAVLQHNLAEPSLGKHCFYLPLSCIDDLDTNHFIMVRGVKNAERFPKARKYSWHHDVPDARLRAMLPTILKHDVLLVGVSRWHKYQMLEFLKDEENWHNTPRIKYIYNPVPKSIFVSRKRKLKYDPNKMVWVSSPHKGLEDAVRVFERVREVSGNSALKLHVFNPGYFATQLVNKEGVLIEGSVPCRELWQHMSESLCVFYPSRFEETFGCFAAEANALHTPVACYDVAGLAESVAVKNPMQRPGEERKFIDMVCKWAAGDRPEVYGQNRFMTAEVMAEWLKIMK